MPTNSSLLSTKEAAKYLGLQPSTLRNARSTGKLAGTTPPAYLKIGTIVRYEKEVLDSWLNQFQPHTSTTLNTPVKGAQS